MSAMASQITSPTTVYSTVYSGAYQRKHQRSASLAFVRGIHQWRGNYPHKGPVLGKYFHLMTSSCQYHGNARISVTKFSVRQQDFYVLLSLSTHLVGLLVAVTWYHFAHLDKCDEIIRIHSAWWLLIFVSMISPCCRRPVGSYQKSEYTDVTFLCHIYVCPSVPYIRFVL